MLEKHDKLLLIELRTEEERNMHGGYKWLVHQDHRSFKAFRTDEGLDYWLHITGVKRGVLAYNDFCVYLDGQFFTHSILGEDRYYEWNNLTDKEKKMRERLLDGSDASYKDVCAIMSNGDYTKGIIEKTDEGNVIWYLNCNETKRIVYPYSSIKR